MMTAICKEGFVIQSKKTIWNQLMAKKPIITIYLIINKKQNK